MKNFSACFLILFFPSLVSIDLVGQNREKVFILTTESIGSQNNLNKVLSDKKYNIPSFVVQHQWQKNDVNSTKIDSLVTYSFSKGFIRDIYSYNNGLLIAKVTQAWKNSWVDSLINIYAYDQNDYLINKLLKINESGIWVNKEKETFVNDIAGNILTYLDQEWDGTTWQNKIQNSNTYNSEGLLVTQLNQVWNNENWLDKYKNVTEYNSKGKVTQYTTLYWDEILWENYSQWINTFDDNGNLLSSTFQEGYLTGWMNSFMITSTYDQSNKIVSGTFKIWDISLGWQNSDLTTYSYDGVGNMTFSVYQQWLNNQWTNYSLTQYTYNSNGDWLTILGQMWDGNAWVSNYKVEYSYSDGLVQTNCYSWLSNAWQVADGSYQIVIHENGTEHYFFNNTGYFSQLYYSNLITGIYDPIAQQQQINVYPNPVHGTLNIKLNFKSPEWGKLTLTDIRGKDTKLYEGILKSDLNSLSYDVNGFMPGTYLLRVETKSKRDRIKVCLIK